MKSKKIAYNPSKLKRAEHLYPNASIPKSDLNPKNILIRKDSKGNWHVKNKD